MKTLHKLITGLSKYIILSSLIKRWRYLGPNSRVCISCLFVFDLGKKKSLFLGISFIYKTHVKETWLEWQRLSIFEMKACGRWLLDWQVSFTLSIWKGGTQSVMEKRFSIFSHFFPLSPPRWRKRKTLEYLWGKNWKERAVRELKYMLCKGKLFL